MRFLIFFFLIYEVGYSQDERYFRDFFSGKLTRDKFQEIKKYKFEKKSNYYDIDLNGDGFKESIDYIKKDNEDWIGVYDYHKNLIFQRRLPSVGVNSFVYKISFHKLGENHRVLIIYFYEGYTEYLNYLATSRVFFLTIDKGDLTKIFLKKGPIVFREREKRNRKYGKRNYKLYLRDIDNDGNRDIIVKYHEISRAFIYRGKGRWVSN